MREEALDREAHTCRRLPLYSRLESGSSPEKVFCDLPEVGNSSTQHLMNVDVVSDFKWMDKLEPKADNTMIHGLSLSRVFVCQAEVFAPKIFFALPN